MSQNRSENNIENENFDSTLPTEDQIEAEAKSAAIFKIAKAERGTFCVMAAMFSIISFVYSVCRVFKDAAVIGKQHPTSISFLKFGVVLPCSFLFVGILQKILINASFTKVFSGVLIVFAVLYIIAGALLLPFSESIQFDFFKARDIFADSKYKVRGLDFLFALALIVNEWTSSFIYVLSEMFGSIVLSWFFMTYSNSLTTPGQSARFVPLFYVLSNLALLGSGLGCKAFGKKREGMDFEDAERVYNYFFIFSGFLILVIFGLKCYLEKYVVCKPIFIRKTFKKKGPKVSVGFIEGVKEMAKSKLLLNISSIVLFYAISTNIIESSFKSALGVGAEHKGVSKSTYASSMNSSEQILVSIIVVLVLLSPFPRLIQTRGWIYVAILCPIITLISFSVVFSLAFYNYPVKGDSNLIFQFFGAKTREDSYIFLENILGVVAVGLMKISKYAAFDITKEAISMQIDSSLRAKYKGIFDGLFGKVGKSIGSAYVIFMTSLFNCRDIRKVTPISASILTVFCISWFYSVQYLNGKYKESVENNAPIDIDLFGQKKGSQTNVDEPAKTVSTESK